LYSANRNPLISNHHVEMCNHL